MMKPAGAIVSGVLVVLAATAAYLSPGATGGVAPSRSSVSSRPSGVAERGVWVQDR